MNQYIMPLALLAAVPLVLWLVRRRLIPGTGELLLAGAGLLAALLLWVPATGPWYFHRYIVAATPLGCLLLAWLLEELVAGLYSLGVPVFGRRMTAVAVAAVLALTSWTGEPVATWLRLSGLYEPMPGSVLKAELAQLRAELTGDRPDPNRATITWLLAQARTGDEVLINYEDIPVMFYTHLAVRGGIGSYRVLDHAAPPPALLVVRRSVGFFFSRIFQEEVERYSWQAAPIDGPDIPWGNIPDPILRPPADRVSADTIIGGVYRPAVK